jgi:hypothetical protein
MTDQQHDEESADEGRPINLLGGAFEALKFTIGALFLLWAGAMLARFFQP